MRIFNHVIELDARARWPFTHFRVHKHEMHTHIVWGKLSLIFGQPHLEPVRVCAECYEQIEVLRAGDEGWDYCENCHLTEGDTLEITTEEYEARHG